MQTQADAAIPALYAAFNRRDITAAVALLAPDVEWANGQHGGHEQGRDAVRTYWTAQWQAIQPTVTPLHIAWRDEATAAIDVHQVVHSLTGDLLLDETVRHVFRFADGLVRRFDIENAGGLAALSHS